MYINNHYLPLTKITSISSLLSKKTATADILTRWTYMSYQSCGDVLSSQWPYGAMVSTRDFESRNLGSNPSRAYRIFFHVIFLITIDRQNTKWGVIRESNPGPLAPKARIIPLDQSPYLRIFSYLIK